MGELKSQLLARATRFCKRKKISLARLGKLAVNDGDFFNRLQKSNGDCTTRNYEKVLRFIRENSDRKFRGRGGPVDLTAGKAA